MSEWRAILEKLAEDSLRPKVRRQGATKNVHGWAVGGEEEFPASAPLLAYLRGPVREPALGIRHELEAMVEDGRIKQRRWTGQHAFYRKALEAE